MTCLSSTTPCSSQLATCWLEMRKVARSSIRPTSWISGTFEQPTPWHRMVATRLMEDSFQKPATSGGPTSRAAAGSAPLPLAFQETGFPRAETDGPKSAPGRKTSPQRQKRLRQSPPIAGLWLVLREIFGSKDWLAEAGGLEPPHQIWRDICERIQPISRGHPGECWIPVPLAAARHRVRGRLSSTTHRSGSVRSRISGWRT